MRTIAWLYVRTRFNLLLFPALALYLLLFAEGSLDSGEPYFVKYLFAFGMLFLLRLFDDLQNREYDKSKPDRVYTNEADYLMLRRLLYGLAMLFMLLLWIVHPLSGLLVLLIFGVINTWLYRRFLHHPKGQTLLPLLKYPVLVMLIQLFPEGLSSFDLSEAILALSVLPAFILYEADTDQEFSLHTVLRELLFWCTFVLFVPFIAESDQQVLLLLIIAIAYVLYRWVPRKFSLYLPLLALLNIRLILAYDF